MIRIDTSKIDNWEEIKRRHSEYIYLEIKPKIETIIKYELLGITANEIDLLDLILKNFDEVLLNNFVLNKHLFKSLISNTFSKDKLKELKTKDEELFKDFNSISKLNKNDLKTLIQKYKINNSYEELKKDELYEIVKTFQNSLKKPNKEELKMNLMEFIFNYDDFSDKTKEKSMNWGRHSLLTMMGIEVCPYCQRNYITNYNEEDNKELTTADLDHFYPQAQYPYFALSLYNFIPSCHTCNSTMKNQDKIGIDTHVYPYTDSMEEDIKFTIKMNKDSKESNQDEKDKNKTLFIERKNLEIDINVNNSLNADKKEKIKNSLKTFKLREVYKNSHSKYVGDLIHNFQKYPKSYTKALGEIFLDKPEETEIEDYKIYQEKLQILNDNFQEIIKKSYTDKIEKGEPLAKLTKDIMEELGIK